MQRKILFRGKRIDNGEWVYGCLFQSDRGDWFIIDDVITSYGIRIEHKRVDPETVGQFVCQYEKMNIFHGDIIRSINHYEGRKPYYVYHEIIWSEKHYCYLAKSIGNDNDEIGNGTVLLWVYFRNANNPKITGNIWDNGRG